MISSVNKKYKVNSLDKLKVNKQGIKIQALLFGIYTMLIPLDQIMNLTGSGTINKYIGMLIIISILLDMFIKRKSFKIKKEYIPLIVYLGFILASCLWSIDIDLTTSSNLRFFMLMLFYIVVSNPNYTCSEKEMIKICSITGGVFVSLYLISTSNTFYNRVFIRSSSGEFVDPNGLSSSLAFGVLFLADYLISTKRKINKIIYFICLVIMIYAMILTGSRGGMIGLIIGIITLLFFGSKSNKYSKVQVIGVLIIIGLVILFNSGILSEYVSSEVLERMTIASMLETGGTGRLTIWKSTLEAFKDKPLLGYGFSTGPSVLFIKYSTYVSTHNDIIFILIGTGLIGLNIFLYFIMQLFYKCIKNRDALSISMFMMLIAFSGTLDYIFNKNFWNVLIYAQIGLGATKLDFNNKRHK